MSNLNKCLEKFEVPVEADRMIKEHCKNIFPNGLTEAQKVSLRNGSWDTEEIRETNIHQEKI